MSILTKPAGGRLAGAQQLILSVDAFATPLLVLCVDRFGWEMFGSAESPQPWSPETIRLEIQDSFQVAIPDYNLDKIMAAIAILVTDDFFRSCPRFIQLCNILSGDTFDPTTFDVATCPEMAWGITEALLLEPADTDEPFSEDIRRYVGHMLKEEGYVNPPDVLKIAITEGGQSDPLAVWADEPDFYQAAFEVQQERTTDITDMLKENMIELFNQLQKLPLNEGSTKELLDRMQQGLKKLQNQ